MTAPFSIQKRDGTISPVDFNKIATRLNRLLFVRGSIDLTSKVSVPLIAQRTIGKLIPGINTAEIDRISANVCANLVSLDPNYGLLGGRILISNIEKTSAAVVARFLLHGAVDAVQFKDKINYLYDTTNQLINPTLLTFVNENQPLIEMLTNTYNTVLRCNLNFDFFSAQTMIRSYLLKDSFDNVIETPFDLFMRVACGLHAHGLYIHNPEGLRASMTRTLMYMFSDRYYTHASPTLFNIGTKIEQLSSCFLLSVGDSLEDIFKNFTDCAHISKWAGGIGINISDIRSDGARIKTTNGKSSGILPMLKMHDQLGRFVNQAGRRPGSIAVYLDVHHPDIETFLELRRNIGSDDLRCRNLFTALWVSDLFMRAAINDDDWYLFDPSECPGINTTYGEEYERLIKTYTVARKFRRAVRAKYLMEKIIESQIETGTPYVTFKDNVNRKNNHAHLGVIKNSNLCVAGSTLILTDRGYVPIQELCGEVTTAVWNGFELSPGVSVHQTGTNQRMLKVTFSNGQSLTCTPQHKFPIELRDIDSPFDASRPIDVPAEDLKLGMHLIEHDFPVISTTTSSSTSSSRCRRPHLYPYTHGLFCAESTQVSSRRRRKLSLLGRREGMLLPYVSRDDVVYHEAGCTVTLPEDIAVRGIVPLDCESTAFKLKWLAGLFDGDGRVREGDVHIDNPSPPFLRDVVYLLNTLGVPGYIVGTRLTVYSGSVHDLFVLGLECRRLELNQGTGWLMRKADPPVHVTRIETLDERMDTFCFTEPLRHSGIFNGIIAKNCNEIVEYSDTKEYAVCTLASICVQRFFRGGEYADSYDYQSLGDVTRHITRTLDHTIDFTFYPRPECQLSHASHRPMAIGIQGLADLFNQLKLPFESREAVDRSRSIMEVIYFNALLESCQLAKDREEDMRALLAETLDGLFPLSRVPEYYDPLFMEDACALSSAYHRAKPARIELINLINDRKMSTTLYYGAYSSYSKSPLATAGRLQMDMFMEEQQLDFAAIRSGQISDAQWAQLRLDIRTHGIRNSMLTGLMPTASTSQLMGSTECFEPLSSNLFTRDTLAGEFTVVNAHLVRELQALQLWTPKLKDQIIRDRGSVQGIAEIPDNLKAVFKTVWEIKQRYMITHAIARAPFVDQSQSMNIYYDTPNTSKMFSALQYAWKSGLKTGSYYLRSQPSVDSDKSLGGGQGDVSATTTTKTTTTTTMTPDCLMCSG
jgi:ribonucleoside-diphosphate reductase alpha chain